MYFFDVLTALKRSMRIIKAKPSPGEMSKKGIHERLYENIKRTISARCGEDINNQGKEGLLKSQFVLYFLNLFNCNLRHSIHKSQKVQRKWHGPL